MKVIDLIRLLRKHIMLLIVAPLLMAGMVIFLTRNPVYKYDSETSLYTGIASGSSVEMDKSTNYFATNTAFDNLINIIKSRKTEEEVAIRLLSQHLLLDKFDPNYISENSYNELKKITPAYIENIVLKSKKTSDNKKISKLNETEASALADSVLANSSFSFNSLNNLNAPISLPASIDPKVYEQTVASLLSYMESSDTNFVYRLLNFEHPHYSIKALSTINVQRIGTSDLIKLKYECDDPGICRQTLAVLTEVCIANYKNVKENRSDAVVKYFEFQLKQAAARLKIAEDKLLEFNKDNNIINYYEQSKAVAVVKEDLDVEYNNKRIKLAGINAVIKRLEEKLGNQQQIQLQSSSILEKRNRLSDINYQISSIDATGLSSSGKTQFIDSLKIEANNLKEDIRNIVGKLYSYNNTAEGLPVSTILNDWINNVIEAENLKAGIQVLGERIKEFQKQYAIYAPAGANIKRIEREISVSEQEFLEILHGLGLAKLKMQDNELSSNIKAVDEPFFPISPVPTKRKILIVVAAFLGFMIVFVTILVLEYFDDSLKNLTKAAHIVKLPILGVLPKILLNARKINLPFIVNRLLEMTVQNLELNTKSEPPKNEPKTILVFSTLAQEGKSVVIGNLARKLKMQGKQVLVLNFSKESLLDIETNQTAYSDNPPASVLAVPIRNQKKPSIIRMLLGYPDNRIDFESQFLENTENYIRAEEYVNYKVDKSFYSVKNYKEILDQNGVKLLFVPDYILIELPAILYYSYPSAIVSESDLNVLVCRSNRAWTEADQGVLDIFTKLTLKKTQLILNGVEPLVIETILGDLPRKRSKFRRAVKNAFRFQFFTADHL